MKPSDLVGKVIVPGPQASVVSPTTVSVPDQPWLTIGRAIVADFGAGVQQRVVIRARSPLAYKKGGMVAMTVIPDMRNRKQRRRSP